MDDLVKFNKTLSLKDWSKFDLWKPSNIHRVKWLYAGANNFRPRFFGKVYFPAMIKYPIFLINKCYS
jgi:hypothetical protein